LIYGWQRQRRHVRGDELIDGCDKESAGDHQNSEHGGNEREPAAARRRARGGRHHAFPLRAGRRSPAESQTRRRLLDDGRRQAVDAHLRRLHQRAVAEQVDDARDAARKRVHEVERGGLKRDRRRPARHPEAMRDVGLDFLAIERLERRADRDALIELAHLGGGQRVEQVQLADQHNLQQLRFVGLEVGDDADLFEHLRRQVLRLVDDQHRAAVNGHQRQQEFVQRADQLVLARGGDASAAHAFTRHDAEIEQDLAQQLLDREERVEDERREDARIELLEQGAADGRLAGADVARQDDEAFLAADGLLELGDGLFVRFAAIEKPRIRRQRERRLYEAVILLVHRRVAGLRCRLRTHPHGNITDARL